MKHTRIIALMFATLLATSPICAAHSGRTDSSGGHRDNKNVSGLGSYHYHCGGHPAHLHPNGVCPYAGGNTVSAASSGASASTQAASQPKPVRPFIAATDMRTFIDGYEVPTFAYTGSAGGAVIIAEDLKDYGYDLSWDAAAKTLHISRNADKPVTPIPMEGYRTAAQGSKAFDISDAEVTVCLWFGTESYVPSMVYNLDGYIAVSVDELKCLGSFSWDGAARAVHIDR